MDFIYSLLVENCHKLLSVYIGSLVIVSSTCLLNEEFVGQVLDKVIFFGIKDLDFVTEKFTVKIETWLASNTSSF
jgi:hypothetical protein